MRRGSGIHPSMGEILVAQGSFPATGTERVDSAFRGRQDFHSTSLNWLAWEVGQDRQPQAINGILSYVKSYFLRCKAPLYL